MAPFRRLGKRLRQHLRLLVYAIGKKANYTDAGFAPHAKGEFHMTAVVMWQENKHLKQSMVREQALFILVLVEHTEV